MIDVIVSQGRIADRAKGLIKGAELTAKALVEKYDLSPVYLGKSTPACIDNWEKSLPQANGILNLIKDHLTTTFIKGNIPVMLNNTCSASLATLPVVAHFNSDVTVLWIDAHGDFNLPDTSESGYLGGMVLSATCGLWDSGFGSGIKPENIILVGARDIDKKEAEIINNFGVRIIPPSQVSGERINKEIGNSKVWIHIDWDVMEPGYLPADYSVPDGLTPAHIHDILSSIPTNSCIGLELAELNATDNNKVNENALSLVIEMVSPFFQNLQVIEAE
ncbi:arginase family protein [Salmonella enterica subsp. enterica]|nr:arginase family protein [Salmonella enterica subsp. enterica serovar Mikawasima]EDN7229169.1 arginase family protein [Salmonella enterica subsp. enterica serovar Mikawasima]